MFDDLQRRFSNAFGRFRPRGVLNESNIKEGLADVRSALLEADVNYNVVQTFMDRVSERAVGQDLIKQVRPDQQIVKIVYDELLALMGETDASIRYQKTGPTILMLCGLQGSGKTTTCGKLARLLAAQGRKPILVAADLQRPAAIEQLKVIGRQIEIPVYAEPDSNPIKVCANGVAEANKLNRDTIILDTAGRLHVDDDLMKELAGIEKKVQPHQVFFVCDALTGQDAVNSAKAFNDALELDGVILTKLDGDARGGAALSIREVTGVPIKFAGMGEKLDRLEPFDPQRVVGQMLGMGDIVGLVEQAQRVVDEEEARRQQEKIAKGKFDLADFRKQITMIGQMGSVGDLMGKIPGMGQIKDELDEGEAEMEVKRLAGIIDSMTPAERENPHTIDIARRRRIAAGAGVDPSEISALVKQFDAMAAMVKAISQMSMIDRVKAIMGLSKSGAFQPGAKLVAPKGGTGKRLSPKERAKLQKQREKDERKLRKEMREQRREGGAP